MNPDTKIDTDADTNRHTHNYSLAVRTKPAETQVVRAIDPVVDWYKYSNVSSIVIIYSKFSSKLAY